MLINADFKATVVVTPDDYHWVDSPQTGVRRVMLDRIGQEQARATSLVRYAPGSAFPPHRHPGGEEILVLEGTFSDERGDFPQGSYLRNPPGSWHAPASREGCLILVKLWQMDAAETAPLHVDTRIPQAWARRAGRGTCHLFTSVHEHVRIERMPPGPPVFPRPEAAAELLVLDGALHLIRQHQPRHLPAGSWVRAGGPDAGACLSSLRAGAQGATVYVKQGRAVSAPVLPAAVLSS